MAALDTNILIRFLVEDDTAQLASARKLIRRCVSDGHAHYVPVTLEVEWVSRASFGFDKTLVVQTLAQLLSSTELSFASESAVEVAVAHSSEGTADFSDCLHVALASQAGEEPLWTFNRAASKITGARLLAL